MIITELSTFFNETIRTLVSTENLDELQSGSEVRLYPSLDEKEVLLKQGDSLIGFNLTESDMWVLNASNTLWLLRSVKKHTVRLQGIKLVSAQERLAQNLSVAIDERIRDDVASKAGFFNPSIEEVTHWLHEEFVLIENGVERIFQASYHGDQGDESITLVGRSFQLILEVSANNALWIRRLVPHSRNRNYGLVVIEGGIDFTDGTIAAQLSNPEEVNKLRELRRDNSSYIALWEEYDRIADRKAQETARKIGYIKYVKFEQDATADGIEWRFYFKASDTDKVNEFLEALKAGDGASIEVHKELPPWLSNQTDKESRAFGEHETRLTATVVRKGDSHLVLSLGRGAKPENTGFIYSSLAGTETSSKRRKVARDTINGQRNPMPQLCHLIEGLPVQAPRYRHLKTLSASAKASFSGEPTSKQLDALELALNTPDIALVLGPPGTGKTQIISALQRRLAEEANRDISREVLVSSFQHDAVDNVVARSDVFGLPAIRVGKRERSANILQQWISKQQSMVENVLIEETNSNSCYQLIERIRNEIALLLGAGMAEDEFNQTLGELAQHLERLGQKHDVMISTSLASKLSIAGDQAALKSRSVSTKADHGLLRVVRSLRDSTEAFQDDGFDRVNECLFRLQRAEIELAEDDIGVLRSISDSYETPDKTTIEELATVKGRLIEQLLPDFRPRAVRTKLDPALADLLKAISTELTGKLSSSVAGIADILTEYQQTLAYQKGRVKQSIENYTTTLGATCQGAVSAEMLNTLSAIGDDNISFDTVIVDEAARANPLDLFIPMSLAKRRIVLVGDHYQLPQILEPEIEDEMRESGSLTEDFAESLKESLFERLYVQLKAREAQDGIKRTVMLDTQFRMHPDIGRFVSEQFYENNGEPALKPGLESSHFEIDVPGFNDAVMHWVDIPNSHGKESRPCSSWVRYIEADRVAELASTIVDQCPQISVGVITFYARQREAIYAALESKDICRRTDEGWEYEPEYVSTKDGQERIRVGSVDAFQGKEFDVVILSMTRSNKYQGLEEPQLNRKFGFLRLPNRLNVAFSRAKKRVIAVGDRKMYSGEEAMAAMPSVYEYAVNQCGESK